MTIKATIQAIALISGFTFNLPSNSSVKNHEWVDRGFLKRKFQDSLPPLHSIKEKDIVSITTSFENHIIIVKLKNGTTYNYLHPDWDMEEYNPSLNKKFREAINQVKITFTRVEHSPEFRGGEDEWDKYVTEYCKQHRTEIQENGPANITLRFMVHMKGQITDVIVVANPSHSNLEPLAKQAILDGPPWIPATQHGYTVVSYADHIVRLRL